MEPIDRVRDNFKENTDLNMKTFDVLAQKILRAVQIMSVCLLDEKKVLSCGNGGSAAEALRFTGLMLNRFEMERPGLPAVALSANSASLTSIADDYQFADIFSKQIRAIGQPGDVLVVLSPSGESHNIIHAIDAAHEREMNIIAITGREGGQLADLIQENDVELRVPSWSTARIQEMHTLIVNCLCDLLDHQLLGLEG